jgi:hypothetical protein
MSANFAVIVESTTRAPGLNRRPRLQLVLAARSAREVAQRKSASRICRTSNVLDLLLDRARRIQATASLTDAFISVGRHPGSGDRSQRHARSARFAGAFAIIFRSGWILTRMVSALPNKLRTTSATAQPEAKVSVRGGCCRGGQRREYAHMVAQVFRKTPT